MDKQHANNIYKKILASIPKEFFKHDDMIESMAIDIYLTYCGVRPACTPFDCLYASDLNLNHISAFVYMTSDKGKKFLDKLKKIPNLDIAIGPYYAFDNSIVVYNTTKNVQPLLNKIKTIRDQAELAKTAKVKNTLLNSIHIPMGELLGYLCPIDISKIIKQPFYSISYLIKNNRHFIGWCPINDKRIVKSFDKLREICDSLKPLGLKVELFVTMT